MNPTYVKAETRITTDRGAKPIAEIYPGEHVLTRTGGLRRVAEVLTESAAHAPDFRHGVSSAPYSPVNT